MLNVVVTPLWDLQAELGNNLASRACIGSIITPDGPEPVSC